MERQEAYIAALHLIEEKGPSFTMAELARKMKVSKRTIYQHFTSKADLLNQTIDYVFDDLLNNKSDEPIETNNSHLSPLEILQLQLQKLPNVYDLDKLLRSSKSFSTNYPEQWARVNRRLDQLGSRVFQMLLNNPRVRILTATEKKFY